MNTQQARQVDGTTGGERASEQVGRSTMGGGELAWMADVWSVGRHKGGGGYDHPSKVQQYKAHTQGLSFSDPTTPQ